MSPPMDSSSARDILVRRDDGGKDGQRIRKMFAGIASKYDFLNHLLSLNVDRLWRRKAVRLLDPRPGERILDLCTGTADLAFAIHRGAGQTCGGNQRRGGNEKTGAASRGNIIGTDFCIEMLQLGEKKIARATQENTEKNTENGGATRPVLLAAADSLRLPFPDRTFDAIAVGFGVRNFAGLRSGLAEMLRVLRPGGRAVILEFTTPPSPWFRALFGFYFRRVLPRIGRAIAAARDPEAREAYSYLPASVSSFPDAEGLRAQMGEAGFSSVGYRFLSLGIAAIHWGGRPAERAPGAPAG